MKGFSSAFLRLAVGDLALPSLAPPSPDGQDAPATGLKSSKAIVHPDPRRIEAAVQARSFAMPASPLRLFLGLVLMAWDTVQEYLRIGGTPTTSK
jgi:hypothetical protein